MYNSLWTHWINSFCWKYFKNSIFSYFNFFSANHSTTVFKSTVTFHTLRERIFRCALKNFYQEFELKNNISKNNSKNRIENNYFRSRSGLQSYKLSIQQSIDFSINEDFTEWFFYFWICFKNKNKIASIPRNNLFCHSFNQFHPFL